MNQKQGIGLHNGRVHDSFYVESMCVTVLAAKDVAVQLMQGGLHVLFPKMAPSEARRLAELLNAAAADVEANERVAA